MVAKCALLIGPFVILLLGGCSFQKPAEIAPASAAPTFVDPLDAVYRIEGDDVPLRNGYFERPAAPGSATKVTVAVFDTQAIGDLNEDGARDAALLLVYRGGGSGTFYYLAVAINQAGAYRGTNALFIGDRIIPEAVTINNGVIAVDFMDRRPDAARADVPTVRATRYAYLDDAQDAQLIAVPAPSEETGWVTFGHEVRSFLPCDRNTGDRGTEHWILGQSPAIAAVRKIYRERTLSTRPYTPVFMELSGSFMDPPNDGFGKDYAGAFLATGLVDVNRTRHCREDDIVVEQPVPGAFIDSPLSIRGRARGSWFFEGDFPIVLEDMQGNTVAKGFVTAQGEWMTKEFVRFNGALSFSKPAQVDRGLLVLKKDNPSERRDLDDHISIPVFFQD